MNTHPDAEQTTITHDMNDTQEKLREACYDEKGALKPKDQCRASMINHLILIEGLGVDEAEDHADKYIRESGFWPAPSFDWDDEEDEQSTAKT